MSADELKKILFIEDEADIRVIAQIALEDIGGFTVKLCGTGYEALAVAENFKPDLFLLDVMMPGLDGPATLRELRNLPRMKDVPAIFMTAKVQANEMAQYKKIDVLGVIVKPFDPMTLAETIQKFWSKNHE